MNIVKLEMRMARTATIGFTLGMLTLFTIFLMFFDTFKGSAALLDTVLKNFPPEFKAAFGFSDINLSDVNGYITFLFNYVVLIGAVFGMKLGVSVLSEEGRTKTADFLLTKPIKRTQIVTGKLVAVLLTLVLQNIIVFIVCFSEVSLFLKDDVSTELLMLLTLSIFLVQLFFVGVGSLLSVLIKRIKNVMPITLGVVFLFFIIELINQSLLDKNLTYLTPFSYFKGSDLWLNRSFNPTYLILDLSIFVGLTVISYIVYNKKDVHAV